MNTSAKITFAVGIIVVTLFTSQIIQKSQHIASDSPTKLDDTQQVYSGRMVDGTRIIEMTAAQYYFKPATIRVQKGEQVALRITSTAGKDPGFDEHGIAIDEYGIDKTLPVGKTIWVNFTADQAGTFSFRCHIYCGPGHSRMDGKLIVYTAGRTLSTTQEPAAQKSRDALYKYTSRNQSQSIRGNTLLEGMEISRHPTSMPPTPNYRLFANNTYQQLKPRNGSITKEVHFTVREVEAEIVNGTSIELWTFNGKVPGPMIRARVGDTINFTLHNPANNSMPHNIDCHCATGPGGGSVSTDTLPGSTSKFQFKLLQPGIYIYHCAFPDIPKHISKGMYGLFVVEPKGGLPEVDHEYYLFQSEYYTEAGGTKRYTELRNQGHLSYSKKYGNLEEPTFVSFNGRPEAVTGKRALGVYRTNITVNETVRLFVGNIGPNLISSFHVIGEIFDRVYVEGSFSSVRRNVQTTLVPAGGAVGVTFTTDVPGTYIPVDHSIFRMHKGAKALLQVDGPANSLVYNPINYSEGAR